MSESPRILVMSDTAEQLPPGVRLDTHSAVEWRTDWKDVPLPTVRNPVDGFDTYVIGRDDFVTFLEHERDRAVRWLANILPVGLVLINHRGQVVRTNRLLQQWLGKDVPEGTEFLSLFDSPAPARPDDPPFVVAMTTALTQGITTKTEIRDAQSRTYILEIAPYTDREPYGVVVVRDNTAFREMSTRLESLWRQTASLNDLSPEQIFEMTGEERIEYLKYRIQYVTANLLNYKTIEIRLLQPDTLRLDLLLAVGMDTEAEQRVLYALPEGNGITGHVAATGRDYLCKDTSTDKLYLQGAANSRSSITVPLVFQDTVIGTINAESPVVGAFTTDDLNYLRSFSYCIPAVLHTYNLLSAEKASAAVASVEAIHRAVAKPINQILHTVTDLIARENPEDTGSLTATALNSILKKAQEIQAVIFRVGESFQPVPAHPVTVPTAHCILRNKRILVVDTDPAVATLVNDILLRFQCCVESVPQEKAVSPDKPARSLGESALLRVKHSPYDVIIAGFELGGMSGHDFMVQLRAQREKPTVPLILTKGFGYDKEHVMVKCRQDGHQEFLYKPFRTDEFLDMLEKIIRRDVENGALS